MEERLIIRASAGSGKTYQLSHRYLGLLASGVGVQTVLASTFTRKAAGEIQNRILLQCAEACRDEKKRADLCRSLGFEISPEDIFGMLEDLVQNMHRMRVYTLDGFFNRIASCFTYEMRLLPGWRMMDDAEDEQLRWEAIRRTLLRAPETALELVRGMSPGRTVRGVAKQIFQVVKDLYQLSQEAGESAWEATKELKLDGRLNEAELVRLLEDLQVETDKIRLAPPDKRLPASLDKCLALGKADNWTELLENASLVKNAILTQGSPTFYKKELPQELGELLYRLGKHAIFRYVEMVQEQTTATYRMISLFGENYENLKREQKAQRFEDVTRYVAEFMKRQSSLRPIYWRLDSDINHLLLDEFQDTSLPQWDILRPMGKYCCELEKKRSFFCVGDVKQAIYRWRNGRAEIFEAVSRTFPGISEQSSNKSWRSSPVIINAVNRVFNDEERPSGIPCEELPSISSGNVSIPMSQVLDGNHLAAWKNWSFAPHTTARTDYPGYWELFSAPEFTEIEYNFDADVPESVDVSEPENAQKDTTLRYAADRIADLYHTIGNHTIGVLVRSNDALQKLIYYLRRRHIPCSEDGKNPLTNAVPVQILLSLLRFIEFPGDRVSWFHVAHSELVDLYPELEWVSPWEEVSPEVRSENPTEVRRLARLAELRNQILSFGFSVFIEQVAKQLTTLTNPPDIRRMQQFIKYAGEYDEQYGSRRISDFVFHVQKAKLADPSCARVSVMTIHMSKGLQFDAVVLPELNFKLGGMTPRFVPGYEENDVTRPVQLVTRWMSESMRELVLGSTSPFWQAMSLNAQERTSESFCMLYVAMTRAIHALYMIVPPCEPKRPAQFTTDVAQILMRTLAAEKTVAPERLIAWDGEPDWYLRTPRALKEREQVAETSSQKVALKSKSVPEPIRFLPPQSASRSLPRRSPSNIEDRELVDLNKKLGFRQANTINGTILHSWYEKIDWLETSLPSDDELLTTALPYGLAKDTLDHLLKNFHNSLKNQNVQNVLMWTRHIPMLCERVLKSGILPESAIPRDIGRNNSNDPHELRWEVYREKELAIRTDRELLLGTVDRLVLLRNDFRVFWADCVDYKTTRKNSSSEIFEEQINKHRFQMLDYQEMLKWHYHLPKEQITLRLVFSMLGVVREV